MNIPRDNGGSSKDNLAKAAQRLRAFQTREPVKLETFKLPWPKRFRQLASLNATSYVSDKDDPLTRAPKSRLADPDGRQGVRKLFRHEHSEDVVVCCGGAPPAGGGTWLEVGEMCSIAQPPLVWYLAELTGLECEDFGGRAFQLQPDKRMGLWASVDTQTLVVLPRALSKVSPDDILVIQGGRLRVTYMGIEN